MGRHSWFRFFGGRLSALTHVDFFFSLFPRCHNDSSKVGPRAQMPAGCLEIRFAATFESLRTNPLYTLI
jgi:hypothetical protein